MFGPDPEPSGEVWISDQQPAVHLVADLDRVAQ
jgi:hypothetical protein